MPEVVALGYAKWNGGRCTDCRTLIIKGNTIFKVAGDGPTTAAGNGPGWWVCGVCAYKIDTSGAMSVVQAKM